MSSTAHVPGLDEDPHAALTAQTLNSDGTPKRPMNAFMIFARRRRPQVSQQNQMMRTGEISKILAREWATMPMTDKQFYLDQAKRLKDRFNSKYPDYVYRRRPNNSRKRRKDGAPATKGSAEDEDEAALEAVAASLPEHSPTEAFYPTPHPHSQRPRISPIHTFSTTAPVPGPASAISSFTPESPYDDYPRSALYEHPQRRQEPSASPVSATPFATLTQPYHPPPPGPPPLLPPSYVTPTPVPDQPPSTSSSTSSSGSTRHSPTVSNVPVSVYQHNGWQHQQHHRRSPADEAQTPSPVVPLYAQPQQYDARQAQYDTRTHQQPPPPQQQQYDAPRYPPMPALPPAYAAFHSPTAPYTHPYPPRDPYGQAQQHQQHQQPPARVDPFRGPPSPSSAGQHSAHSAPAVTRRWDAVP